MNIGSKIRELRLAKSITQEQLANCLSVSVQCVSKWENNVTIPDVQMLPQLSVFFGVTIDELFDLTEDIHIRRIENMLAMQRMIDLEEFVQAERFLLKKEAENNKDARYSMVLADLYNHMADGYRYRAEEKAKRAIGLEPEVKYHHTLLRMAQQGCQIDWNFENHTRRIEYYKTFVAEHPEYERGYVCLLDELLNANRLQEAEVIMEQMEETLHNARSAFYRGYICWKQNERIKAWEVWTNMLERYKEEWLPYALLGDCMANYCEYEKAIEYYEKSLELQEKPRYTDSQISIAMIYEIMGQNDKAVIEWKKVLDILKEEHQVQEGYMIQQIDKEILRLENGGNDSENLKKEYL